MYSGVCKSPCLCRVFIYYRLLLLLATKEEKYREIPCSFSSAAPVGPSRRIVANTQCDRRGRWHGRRCHRCARCVCCALYHFSSVWGRMSTATVRARWLQYHRDPALPFGTRPTSIPPPPRPLLPMLPSLSQFPHHQGVCGRDRGVAFPRQHCVLIQPVAWHAHLCGAGGFALRAGRPPQLVLGLLQELRLSG